ncbi:MAG TPA: class I SAM-dependent methyltransferase [Thermoanaerobaculia bacterium]|nr:class I SAM-dependent methyltransferase [Thermoanaerobaculia bacterium]
MNPYRRRILDLALELTAPHRPFARALDFGSGDGWFAASFRAAGLAGEVVPVDVLRRRRTVVEPRLYDGARLPFDDGSFDLAYAVDVLHHCPDPPASLAELLRVTRGWLLLKDHTHRGLRQRCTLALLDEIGNRRFGVPSLYRYQRGWEWLPQIAAAGFTLERLIHPAPCHGGALGGATNGLQFVALWRRNPG